MKKNQMFIALIRGINVGGNNIVKMEALREACSEAGFENVSTFIQSGNVIFESKKHDAALLEKTLEKLLEEHFSVKTRVVVIGSDTYRDIVKHFPKVFARDGWKHNVFFLGSDTEAEAIAKEFSGIDEGFEVSSFRNVVYWSQDKNHKHASKIVQKLLAHKSYKQMTIRNDRTTRKLLEFL